MEVFVFPLGNVVFYPSTSKPLNVYEPQYIQMVHDSIRLGIPIALGYVDQPDLQFIYEAGAELNFVRSVAGYGIPQIIEKKPDGSLLVFLQGRGKVKLGRVCEGVRPYIVCEAEVISENHQVKTELIRTMGNLRKVLIKWIEKHIGGEQNQQQFLKNIRTPEEILGCFASYLVADHDFQQVILESNDINEKIDLVSRLILSRVIV